MQAFVDNIWSSPSTLHFRVVVVTDARHRVYKQECHIDIDSLAAVDIDHMRSAMEGTALDVSAEDSLFLIEQDGRLTAI